MKNFYFTFGQNHWHKDGFQMHNYWVRVKSDSYENARIKFIEKFTSIYMSAKDKWAFQYDEEEFDNDSKQFYPLGEFMLIE